jgi:hypothetical protein
VAPDSAAYHGLAGNIVGAIDPHTEADRVAILVQFLAACGNAIGRGPYFAVEATRHYPILNVVLVGETAKGRKGTAWERVRGLMRMADPQWADENIESGLSSGEGLIWAVRDPILRKEPIKEKGKITGHVEVTADDGVTDKRRLVIEPEFAKVLRVASREGNTLSATVREAWDSGRLRIMTKNSPAVATGAHVTIVGHVTKDELLRNLSETEAANGFANRFLWVCAKRSKYLPEGGGLVDLAPLADELRASLDFARELGDTDIPRDETARKIWVAVYADLSTGRPGMTGAVLGRAEAQVMRLALVYAFLDRSETIQGAHLRAALALWEYVERSVQYVFGESTGDRVADSILAWLRGAPAGLTRTEINHNFRRHVPAIRIDAALEALRRHGLASVSTEPSGGRPVGRWRCEECEPSENRQGDSSPHSLLSPEDGSGG